MASDEKASAEPDGDAVAAVEEDGQASSPGGGSVAPATEAGPGALAVSGGRRRILCVDDRWEMRELLETYLSEQGFEVVCADSADDALEVLDRHKFHVVLSDILMPGMDGLDLLERIKGVDPACEVIMVTAVRELDTALKALRRGAFDLLTKPMNLEELGLTVERAIERRKLVLENRRHREHLEREVEARTRELDRITVGLVAALEKANDYKDVEMGSHIRRVCGFSGVLASGLGLSSDLVTKIRRYASLHDVGKVGIRDSILKKPGKLTEEEFEEMKEHTVIGHEILRSAHADPVALNIVLYHHERYGGGGYPFGLVDDQIPLEARIVSLADAYDAMTSKRCYKEAYAEEKACEIIREERGEQFDPDVVDVFFGRREEILDIKTRFRGMGDR